MFSSNIMFLVTGTAVVLAIRSIVLKMHDDGLRLLERKTISMKTISEYAHINTAEIKFERPEFDPNGSISKYANIDTASIKFEPVRGNYKEGSIGYYANIDTSRER